MIEPEFRRSSYCSDRACVEVAKAPGVVLMRGSKNPAGPVLAFGADGWNDFLRGVQSGEFEGGSGGNAAHTH